MAKKVILNDNIIPDSIIEGAGTKHSIAGQTDYSINKQKDLFGKDLAEFKQETGTEAFALTPSGIKESKKDYSETIQRNITRAEDIEAYTQSNWEKLGNGLVKFGGRVFTSVAGSTVGTLYGLMAWARDGEFKSFYDNEFQDGLDGINDYLAENFKHHYTSDPNDWEIGNFWFDKVFDGLGFATGAVISGMTGAGIVGKIGKGIKFTKALKAGAVKELKDLTAKKASQSAIRLAENKVARLDKIGKNLSQIPQTVTSTVTGAAYESGVEARHAFDTIVDELKEEYKAKNGTSEVPEEAMKEITKLAGRSANGIFAANMALVGSGNFVQFGKHLGMNFPTMSRLFGKQSIGKRGTIEALETEGAKTLKDKLSREAVKEGSAPLRKAAAIIKNPLVESQEEMLQGVISGTGEEYALKKYNNPDAGVLDLIDAAIKSTRKTYGSAEGWEEGLIGAIIGGAGVVGPKRKESGKYGIGVMGGVAESISEYKADEANRDKIVDIVNNNDAVSSLKSSFQHAAEMQELSKVQDEAIIQQKQKQFQDAKDEALFSYVDARKQAGMMSTVYEDLNEMRQAPIEEFKETFGIPKDVEFTEEQKIQEINDLQDKLQNIENHWKEAQELFPFEDEDVQRKVAFNSYKFDRAEKRKETLTKEIDELTGYHFTATRMPLLQREEDGTEVSQEEVFKDVPKKIKQNNEKLYLDKYQDYLTLEKEQAVLAEERRKILSGEGVESLQKSKQEKLAKKQKEIIKAQEKLDEQLRKEERELEELEANSDPFAGDTSLVEESDTITETPVNERDAIEKRRKEEIENAKKMQLDPATGIFDRINDKYNDELEELEAKQKADELGTDPETTKTAKVNIESQNAINDPNKTNEAPINVEDPDVKTTVNTVLEKSNKGKVTKGVKNTEIQEQSKGIYSVGKLWVDAFNLVAVRTRDYILDPITKRFKNSSDFNNDKAVNISGDLFLPGELKEGDTVEVRLIGDPIFKTGQLDSEGKEITLDNQKGTPEQIMGVYYKDNLIGYIHDQGFIHEGTTERGKLVDNKDNIDRNREALSAFRKKVYDVLKEGDVESYPVKVLSKSPGNILTTVNREFTNKVSDILEKDSTPEILVAKESGLFLGGTPVEDTFLGDKLLYNLSSEDLLKIKGATLIAVPSANGTYILSLLKNGKIADSSYPIMDSIQDVLTAYLENNTDILDEYELENDAAAVQKYLNNFIYATEFQYRDKKDKTRRDPNYIEVGMDKKGNRVIKFESEGSALVVKKLGTSKNSKALLSKIKNSYNAVDLSKIQESSEEVMLSNGPVQYRDLILSNLYANFSSQKVDAPSGSTVTYVANPIVALDVEGKFGKVEPVKKKVQPTDTGNLFTEEEFEAGKKGTTTDVKTDIESRRQEELNNKLTSLETKLKSITGNTVMDKLEKGDINKEIKSIEAELNSTAPVEIPNSLKGLVVTTPIHGKEQTIFTTNSLDRTVVFVNIDGKRYGFYQSTKGTDGKIKNHWYPFYGKANSWVVKDGGGKNWKYNSQASPELQSKLEKAANKLNAEYGNTQFKNTPYIHDTSEAETNTLIGSHITDAEQDLFNANKKEYIRIKKKTAEEGFKKPADAELAALEQQPTQQTSKVGGKKIKSTKNTALNKFGKRGGKRRLSEKRFTKKDLLKGLRFLTNPKTGEIIPSEQTYNITKAISVAIHGIVTSNKAELEALKEEAAKDLELADTLEEETNIKERLEADLAEKTITLKDAFNQIKEELGLFQNNYSIWGTQSKISAEDLSEGALDTPELNAARAETFELVLNNFDFFKDGTIADLKTLGFKVISTIENKPVSEVDIEALQNEAEEAAMDGSNPDRTKRDYDAMSVEENPMEKLSSSLKLLLSTIPNDKASALGTDMYHDLDTVYGALLSILNNSIADTSQDVIEKLKKHAKNKPFLNEIIYMLESDEMSQQDKNMFFAHFKKIYQEFEIVLHDKDSYKIIKANRNTVAGLIKQQWLQDLGNVPAFKADGVDTIVDEDYVENKLSKLWDNIEKDDYSVKATKKFLSAVGINMSTAALTELKENSKTRPGFKVDWEQLFGTGDTAAFTKIKEAFDSKVEANENPLENEGFVTKLAKLETEFSENLTTNSHLNSEGKSIFAYSNSIHLQNRLHKLKGDSGKGNVEFIKKLRQLPFLKHSKFLNKLEKQDKAFSDNFEITVLDTLVHSKKEAQKFANLSEREKIIAQLNLFTNGQQGKKKKNGQTVYNISKFIVAKADKGTVHIMTALRHKTSSTSSQIKNGKVGRKDMSALLNIVKSEYARIKDAQTKHQEHKKKTGENLFDDINNYNPFKFYLFEELNDVLDVDPDGLLPRFENAEELITPILTEVLLKEEARTKERLTEAGVIDSENNIQHVDSAYVREIPHKENFADFLVRDYVINNMIAHHEYQMLFQGDIAIAGGKSVAAAHNKMFKRSAKEIAPANRGAKYKHNDYNHYNQIFLQDAYNGSLNLDGLKKLYGKDSSTPEDYSYMEGTDAQEVTLLTEHINVMYYEGRIEDDVYNRLMKEASKPNPYFQPSDLRILLNPHKPVYVGNKYMEQYGAEIPVYIKSSSFPLIPQLIKDTEWGKLEKIMRTNKDSRGKKQPIHRAVFLTGAKLGAYKTIDGWNKQKNPETGEDIADNKGRALTDGTFNEKAIKDALKNNAFLTLDRDNFGIQQDVPYDPKKKKILEGSQLVKLIQDGISSQELLEEFNNLHNEITEAEFQSFLTKVGAIQNPDGSLYFKDHVSLQKLLIEELVERGNYSDNDLVSLELDPVTKMFKLPIWGNPKSSQFEALLNSLVSKKVIRQKMPGKSYVLGTEEGWIGTTTEIVTVTSGLKGPKYDPSVGLKPQRIGYSKGFTRIEQEEYEKLQKENPKEAALYKRVVFPAQVLMARGNFNDRQMVGYRIPTQGLNSMSAMEVVGYLPEYMGDLLIAPKDFTVQMGSDFDIDKIFVHRWHENKKGKRITESFVQKQWEEYKSRQDNKLTEAINEKNWLSALGKMFDENLDESINEDFTTKAYEELIEKIKNNTLTEQEFKDHYTKKIKQNKIMDIYYNTLVDENNLKDILRPLDFGNLEKVAERLEEPEKHHPLAPIRQIDNYQNGNAGKFGVGAMSLLSTFNSSLQAAFKATGLSIDVKLRDKKTNKYYIPKFKFNGKSDPVSSINDSEMTLDGTMKKADVISAIQSASVDNINELLIDKINYNRHTHDAASALALLGLTDEYIAYFLAQPVIVDYVKTIQNLSDAYSNLKGIELNEVAVEMVESKLGIEYENAEFKNFTTEELFSEIDKNTPELQYGILIDFLDYSEIGKNLNKINNAIQPATSGLGKNKIALDIKLAKANDLAETKFITNASALVGTLDGKNSNGNSIINPTTIAGKGLEIVRKTSELYDSLFSINKVADRLAEKVAKIQGKELSNLTEKERVSILKFVKSYMYSASLPFYGDKDVHEYRRSLFFGTNSLAHRWKAFKEANPESWLGRRLQIYTNKSNKKPNTIVYQASQAERTDDVRNTNSFIEMLLSEDAVIRELATDTISYTYLRGGVQDAHSLLKFIPASYLHLQDTGVELEKFVETAIESEWHMEVMLSQYFQHNPYKAPKVENLEDATAQFVAIENENTYDIYRKVDKGEYTLLDRLGSQAFVETQYNQEDALSDIKDNQRSTKKRKPVKKPAVAVTTNITGPSTPKVKNNIKSNKTAVKYGINTGSASTVVSNIAKKGLAKNKKLAQILAPLLENVSISLNDLSNLGEAGANGSYLKGAIEIDNLLTSQSEFERVVLHEALHAVLDGVISNPTSEQAELIKKLNTVLDIARDNRDQFEVQDGLQNLDEFISELMTDADFQRDLASIDYTKDQSLLEKIIEIFQDLLNNLSGDTVTQESISTVLELIDTVQPQKGTKEDLNLISQLESYGYLDNIPAQEYSDEELMQDFEDYFNDTEEDTSITSEELKKLKDGDGPSLMSLSAKRVSKELASIHQSSEELKSIGSPKDYADYLSTVFSDSEYNSIVYHGSGNSEKIDELIPTNDRIYFSDKLTASRYADWNSNMRVQADPFASVGTQVIPAIINLKNPVRLDGVSFKETETNKSGDGIIGTNIIDPLGGRELQLVVRSSDQVHILGSTKDVEGFRDFMQAKQKPQDSYLRDTYFSEGDVTSSLDILNTIAESDHPLNKLAKHLIPFAEQNNAKVSLVNTIDEGLSVLGRYEQLDNSIEISENANKNHRRPSYTVETTLLHEIIHSLSSDALSLGGFTDFNKMYEAAKKALGEVTDYESTYPLSTIDEFITGIFTNSKFINLLKEVEPVSDVKEYKNLFQEVMDSILKLFNIFESNKTLYTQAFAAATNVLQTQMDSTIEANAILDTRSYEFSKSFGSLIESEIFKRASDFELEEMKNRCK